MNLPRNHCQTLVALDCCWYHGIDDDDYAWVYASRFFFFHRAIVVIDWHFVVSTVFLVKTPMIVSVFVVFRWRIVPRWNSVVAVSWA
jgi:hypothetical protein